MIGARLLRAALLAALVAGCNQSTPSTRPLVVATFYPVYEFARQVAGDRATVVSLVPPGVEPHDWEPSPQQMIDVQKARLFVYNGAGFEPWVDKLLQDTRDAKVVAVDTTRGMALLPAPSAGAASAQSDHTHARGPTGRAVDPHVWLDPELAEAQVDAIRAALAASDPPNAAASDANARAYRARLAALDTTMASGLRDCDRRDIVVSHASFAYLARRYALTQVALMGLAPEAEPSPASLAAIADVARKRRATAIFFETLVSARLAETLAREIGARTLLLNPAEGLTKEEAAAGKDYIALMEGNLANLRLGLGCR